MKETRNKIVLLIDDRTNRQVEFTMDTGIDLKIYEDIIEPLANLTKQPSQYLLNLIF